MSGARPVRWGPVAAALSAAAGLAATVWAGAGVRAQLAVLRRTQSDAAEARRIEAEWERRRAAQRLWTELPNARLTPPETLFRAALPGLAAPEFVEREAEPLADGWRRRTVEAAIPEAPLEAIGRFVAAAAAARPPWRLAGLRVTATESGRGYGRATLTLEGLERGEPAP